MKSTKLRNFTHTTRNQNCAKAHRTRLGAPLARETTVEAVKKKKKKQFPRI